MLSGRSAEHRCRISFKGALLSVRYLLRHALPSFSVLGRAGLVPAHLAAVGNHVAVLAELRAGHPGKPFKVAQSVSEGHRDHRSMLLSEDQLCSALCGSLPLSLGIQHQSKTETKEKMPPPPKVGAATTPKHQHQHQQQHR